MYIENGWSLVDKFIFSVTLPPAALPIGDASLTHVIKLAAHSLHYQRLLR
jgi:hypothetical protein